MAEKINYRGYTIKIFPDDDPMDPREWDNLGRMICFHPHYNLGDENIEYYYEQNIQSMIDWLRVNAHDHDRVLYLPLILLDHSSLSMSTSRDWPFNCPWDAGQVGWIYVTKETLRKEYGKQRISKRVKNLALQVLAGEVEDYSSYISGDCWGYAVKDPEDEVIDSCCGFLGSDNAEQMLQYARESIDEAIEEKLKAHAKRLKEQIKAGTPLAYRTPAPTIGR